MPSTSRTQEPAAASPQPAEQGPRLDLIAWLVLSFRRPDRDQLETLRGHDPRLLLERAGLSSDTPPLDLSWLARPVATLLSELQEEHVRLFVASRTNPVAHLDALAYFQDREDERSLFLTELAAELSRLGLHPDSRQGLPPDHLTLLLELLYARGIRKGKPMDESFLERYFRGWVPQFLERLASARPAEFYRDAARVLAAVLAIDDSSLFVPRSWNDADRRTQN